MAAMLSGKRAGLFIEMGEVTGQDGFGVGAGLGRLRLVRSVVGRPCRWPEIINPEIPF